MLPREHPFLRAFLCLSLVLIFWAPSATAQGVGTTDDVHVSPRVLPDPAPAKEAVSAGSSFNTHSKPYKTESDLVLVPVTITDPMNRLVTGLDKENFNVYEGKEAQEIKHFSSEDAPVSLGVIFDMSGSMSSKIERAREAVVEFFKTANPQDEFFLVSFNDHAELVSAFTNSADDLQNRLSFTGAKGRTALLDAIYLGLSEMRTARNGKRALLIISDGGDNNSRYNEKDIKRLVREANTQLYSIGIFDALEFRNRTPEELNGPSLLNEVTALSGGRAFAVGNINDLPDIASKIGAELRNQYILGYRPSDKSHDARWRKVKVKLRAPKGLPPLSVSAKTGYYGPGS
jgi:Ca-activated chloride channel family protein